MFYHVLIEKKEKPRRGKNSNKIFKLDFESKDKVINEIIIPYLKKHEFQFNGYLLSADKITQILVREGDKRSATLSKMANDNLLPGITMYVSPSDAIQYNKYTKDITREIFKESSKKRPEEENIIDKQKVFIIHDHDNLEKLEVSNFIKKLGFEPIILHEQSSGGATIIEKIENYSNVGFGIVLYTPYDVGAKKEELKLSSRARQNVVFEHGYLIGKLKRDNVCALVKGGVEPPNDISGVVYVTHDVNGTWKLNLAKELRKAGYEVDMNKSI
ncbi:DNA-binding protein [Agarivorans sp. B2Z047]|uniref:TIR domain-containing protein n=1 Tax=Agarivorans sp. B2Z047 TaxID=2652721 RepID=UPI00128E2382|nr:nucleotide-binding protein [Agarivorans sp. B2Z047]MPW31904.1 DNA-binding protein [Agarivorans sp. B2Z047]UQN44874.1 nucleotide-binding protein [Agarivorans sp. B2Z047]